MDADDTIAAAEDAIIFAEADEGDDDNNLAMLDLDTHPGKCDSVHISGQNFFTNIFALFV